MNYEDNDDDKYQEYTDECDFPGNEDNDDIMMMQLAIFNATVIKCSYNALILGSLFYLIFAIDKNK